MLIWSSTNIYNLMPHIQTPKTLEEVQRSSKDVKILSSCVCFFVWKREQEWLLLCSWSKKLPFWGHRYYNQRSSDWTHLSNKPMIQLSKWHFFLQFYQCMKMLWDNRFGWEEWGRGEFCLFHCSFCCFRITVVLCQKLDPRLICSYLAWYMLLKMHLLQWPVIFLGTCYEENH